MLNLLQNSVFLLLLIVILGEFIGRIKFMEFSLDSAAVIFVAMIFGYFGYKLNPLFQTFGLVLFIYSIGLQAGPGFVSSFKTNGLKLTLGAIFLVTIGMVSVAGCAFVFNFNAEIAAGLFSGALTSTPGLAVAAELTTGQMASSAYGLTYCIGVIGTILFIKFLPKLTRTNVVDEENILNEEVQQGRIPVSFMDLEVTNPNIFGKKVADLHLNKIAPVTLTRLLKKDQAEAILVSADTILNEGDKVRVVGQQDDLEGAQLYIGRIISDEIHFKSSLKTKRIIVSQLDVIGHTLRSLNLWNIYNIKVERMIRNGFDIAVNLNTRLNMGDVLYIVGNENSVENATKVLGNNIEATYTTRVTSILFGILIGFLLGQIPLFIPFVGVFKLGTTGGVLAAGLVLSYFKKTGPFVWDIPATANSFIRELGLLLFLATVGSSAGATVIETAERLGGQLFIAGIIVTIVPLLMTYFLGRYLLKIHFLRLLGVLTGGMTSTPGLAASISISNTQFASTAYATVYPVALVGMILYTKLLVWMFT